VDGIGRYIRIAALEVDIDYNQVVDVIQVVSDLIRGNLSCHASHDEIARRSIGDLVAYMWWYMELPVRPTEFELTLLAWHTACVERISPFSYVGICRCAWYGRGTLLPP
jgi:hypothetical protein